MANFAIPRILHISRGIGYRFFPFLLQAKKGYSSSGPVTLLHLPLLRHGSSSPEGFSTSASSQSSKAPIPGYFSEQIGESSGFEEINVPERQLFDNDDSRKCELDAISDRVECRNTRQEIEEVAVGLLAARAFTAIELQRKLRGKKYPLHIVESIVDDFKSSCSRTRKSTIPENATPKMSLLMKVTDSVKRKKLIISLLLMVILAD